MIRIGIVDDEENARRVISKYLERYCENYEIVFETDEYQDAIDLSIKHNPDLLYLDIQILNGLGIDVAANIKDETNTKIIFTTAYNEYAIQALRLKAFDYLLKPIDIEDFIISLNKALEIIKTEKNNISIVPTISIVTMSGIQLIDKNNVSTIKAEGSYCEIKLIDGKSITVSKPLKHIENQIEKNSTFIKIHKSYLVNTSVIKSLDRTTNEVILKDDSRLPISRSNLKMVFNFFNH